MRRLGPGLNWGIVVPVVSGALLAVGLGLLACLAVAVAGGDGGTRAFGVTAAVVLPLAVLGVLAVRVLPAAPLRARDGFFAVTAAWVACAAAGAAPFLLQGTFDDVTDAFFESMSGFTTTGASLITVIEDQPDAILLWRSVSQWIGGVGIVVLVVAIAPATGLASSRVFYAETSGVTAERLTPRIADTAKIISAVYLSLTTLGILAYAIAGMSPWDALNHALTSVSSGGFSTRTVSLGAFDSTAIELVAIVLMVCAGINFAFYWRALRGRDRLWPQAAEVRAYLVILALSTLVVCGVLLLEDRGPALRDAAFTAVSLTTGTGFTTTDPDLFPDGLKLFLLLLMFVGGCAGSTSGGLKVIRVLLLAKAVGQEVQRQIQPKAVQVLRVRGRVFPEAVRRGVFAFFSLYLTVFALGTLVMASVGLDPLSAASSVAATLNVVGPGFGEVGGIESYVAVPEAGRWVLSVLMLIGRLEVFTVLVLLTPAFWRPNVA